MNFKISLEPMTIDSESSGSLFAANLLFRSSRDGVFDDANLWEESLVLIEASSADDAEAKAALLAVSAESSYVAMDGTCVAWTFFKVERVQLVDQPLRHGSELFSRYLRHAEVQSLLTPFEDLSTQK
jgi:hypothetical protein